jgi:hypothetical protein
MAEPSVAQLEQAFFDQVLKDRRRKVVTVIAMATENFPGFWDEGRTIAHAEIDEALARLVVRRDVLTFGDINELRPSELSRR